MAKSSESWQILSRCLAVKCVLFHGRRQREGSPFDMARTLHESSAGLAMRQAGRHHGRFPGSRWPAERGTFQVPEARVPAIRNHRGPCLPHSAFARLFRPPHRQPPGGATAESRRQGKIAAPCPAPAAPGQKLPENGVSTAAMPGSAMIRARSGRRCRGRETCAATMSVNSASSLPGSGQLRE